MTLHPLILYIETATTVCSVCLAEGNRVVAEKTSPEANSHAKLLAPMLKELMSENHVAFQNLSAVALSEGPGSYTGLRIGLSTAKGICYAANLPMLMVNTLQAMAYGMKEKIADTDALLIPVLDARRNDVYWSVFNQNAECLEKHECNSADEVVALLKSTKQKCFVAGSGAWKFGYYQDVVELIDDFTVSSKHLIPVALLKFHENNFADLAYSEPVYRNYPAPKTKA